MFKIDMNSDLGESFGNYTLPMNDEVLRHVTSANVACGFHAGDPMVMEHTVALAKQFGVNVGVHPGFPDLQGFGRRRLEMKPVEIKNLVTYQIGALFAFTKNANVPITHMLAHGALGNQAVADMGVARAICEAGYAFDPKMRMCYFGNSYIKTVADELGMPTVALVFADRAYMEDGSLVPRSQPGAMIEDEEFAIARVVRMIKDGRVTAITGKDIDVKAEAVLVHGDGPKALDFVLALRKAFENEKIEVRSFLD